LSPSSSSNTASPHPSSPDPVLNCQKVDCESRGNGSDVNSDITGVVGKPILYKVFGSDNNTWSSMLIDSGSEVTLMHKKLFDKLHNPAKLKVHSKIKFYGIDGPINDSLGAADVLVKLGSFSIKYRIHVTDKLPCDILLGADFMKASSSILDTNVSVLYLGHKATPVPMIITSPGDDSVRQVQLASTETLKPRHIHDCKVELDYIPSTDITAIFEIDPLFEKEYSVKSPRTLIHIPANHNSAFVPFMNLDCREKLLPKDVLIGSCHIMEDSELKFVGALQMEVDKNKDF
jgi:hypothetical protein